MSGFFIEGSMPHRWRLWESFWLTYFGICSFLEYGTLFWSHKIRRLKKGQRPRECAYVLLGDHPEALLWPCALDIRC